MSIMQTSIDCKHCGEKEAVFIHITWANACEACGGEHNGFGQPLAPRSEWGWDTDEQGDF